MMAAKMFRADQDNTWLVHKIDALFDKLHASYQRRLHGSLDTWPVQIVMGGLLLVGTIFLFATSASELAPEEDQGIVAAHVQGAPNATAQQMLGYAHQAHDLAKELPEYDQMFQLTGLPTINQGRLRGSASPEQRAMRYAVGLSSRKRNQVHTVDLAVRR